MEKTDILDNITRLSEITDDNFNSKSDFMCIRNNFTSILGITDISTFVCDYTSLSKCFDEIKKSSNGKAFSFLIIHSCFGRSPYKLHREELCLDYFKSKQIINNIFLLDEYDENEINNICEEDSRYQTDIYLYLIGINGKIYVDSQYYYLRQWYLDQIKYKNNIIKDDVQELNWLGKLLDINLHDRKIRKINAKQFMGFTIKDCKIKELNIKVYGGHTKLYNNIIGTLGFKFKSNSYSLLVELKDLKINLLEIDVTDMKILSDGDRVLFHRIKDNVSIDKTVIKLNRSQKSTIQKEMIEFDWNVENLEYKVID